MTVDRIPELNFSDVLLAVLQVVVVPACSSQPWRHFRFRFTSTWCHSGAGDGWRWRHKSRDSVASGTSVSAGQSAGVYSQHSRFVRTPRRIRQFPNCSYLSPLIGNWYTILWIVMTLLRLQHSSLLPAPQLGEAQGWAGIVLAASVRVSVCTSVHNWKKTANQKSM